MRWRRPDRARTRSRSRQARRSRSSPMAATRASVARMSSSSRLSASRLRSGPASGPSQAMPRFSKRAEHRQHGGRSRERADARHRHERVTEPVEDECVRRSVDDEHVHEGGGQVPECEGLQPPFAERERRCPEQRCQQRPSDRQPTPRQDGGRRGREDARCGDASSARSSIRARTSASQAGSSLAAIPAARLSVRAGSDRSPVVSEAAASTKSPGAAPPGMSNASSGHPGRSRPRTRERRLPRGTRGHSPGSVAP